MLGDRMLGGDSTKSHAHHRIRTRGEHIHQAVLNQLTRSIFDVVGESETNTLALADPVFLHGAHTVGPAR